MTSEVNDRRLANAIAYRLSTCRYRDLIRLAKWLKMDKPTRKRRYELEDAVLSHIGAVGVKWI